VLLSAARGRTKTLALGLTLAAHMLPPPPLVCESVAAIAISTWRYELHRHHLHHLHPGAVWLPARVLSFLPARFQLLLRALSRKLAKSGKLQPGLLDALATPCRAETAPSGPERAGTTARVMPRLCPCCPNEHVRRVFPPAVMNSQP
jgi:hypothetical protein